MELIKIIRRLEEIAPLDLAEDFDNGKIGLILDRNNKDINKIAVSLDITENVLKETVKIGANLLICHHTLIFHPINKISKKLSDLLKIAINNDISIYTMHTNYDKADKGVNDILAEILGLKNIQKLELGRIGNIKPCTTQEFASIVSKKLKTHVVFAGNKEIKKLMVIGGSGFKKEYIDIALSNNVDGFVSGDLRHDIIRYSDEISLFDATHYATEAPSMEYLCKRLPVESIYIDDRPTLKVIS